MDGKILQLTGLYNQLKPVYREVLAASRCLRDLCVGNSFVEADDCKKLEELLLQREKLLEQAVVRQKEAATLQDSLREALALGPAEINAANLAEHVSTPAARRCNEVSGQVELLISEIVSTDAVTGRALEGSLQVLTRKMTKIQIEKKASKVYRDQGFQLEGFFVDSSK